MWIRDRLQGEPRGVGVVGEAPVPIAPKELRLLPDGVAEDLGGVRDEEVHAAVGVVVGEGSADRLRGPFGAAADGTLRPEGKHPPPGSDQARSRVNPGGR